MCSMYTIAEALRCDALNMDWRLYRFGLNIFRFDVLDHELLNIAKC